MNSLIVAIDGSSASSRAVQIAGQIARAEGASIRVVDVRKTGEFHAVAEAYEHAALLELKQAGVNARLEVRGGDVADEILAAARAARAGLLIMGSRGRSPVGGLLLGSVSQDVVARATCPVLLVRAGADGTAPLRTILLAVEGIAGSGSLLAVTVDLAKSLQAKVVVVHASYPGGEDLERSLYHARQTHGEQAVAATVAKLRELGVETGQIALTTRSSISRALAACADSIGADLIVMGSHRPSGSAEGAGADLSLAVSRRTKQPVLVTRER